MHAKQNSFSNYPIRMPRNNPIAVKLIEKPFTAKRLSKMCKNNAFFGGLIICYTVECGCNNVSLSIYTIQCVFYGDSHSTYKIESIRNARYLLVYVCTTQLHKYRESCVVAIDFRAVHTYNTGCTNIPSIKAELRIKVIAF